MQTMMLAVMLILAGAGPAGAQTARQQVLRAAVLARPALDGVTLAGLTLGREEAEVLALLGPAHGTGVSRIAERALRYDVARGVRLDVHVRAGRVAGIAVTAPAQLPSPQTARGVRLGMPVARVLELYGPATGGRLWYAAEGVAFNVDAPADTVYSILIFPRGTAPPR